MRYPALGPGKEFSHLLVSGFSRRLSRHRYAIFAGNHALDSDSLDISQNPTVIHELHNRPRKSRKLSARHHGSMSSDTRHR